MCSQQNHQKISYVVHPGLTITSPLALTSLLAPDIITESRNKRDNKCTRKEDKFEPQYQNPSTMTTNTPTQVLILENIQQSW